MGLCDLLLALRSSRLYGYQLWTRERLVVPSLRETTIQKSNSAASTVFGWLQNMTAIAGLMTWFGICVVRAHFSLLLEHIIDTGRPRRRFTYGSEPAGTLKVSTETSSHTNPPSNPTRHGTVSSRSP